MKIYLSVFFPNYADALLASGAQCVPSADLADALLLTGGGDISPAHYGQKNCGSDPADPARDERELSLIRDFLRRGLPIFGICRGLQVINISFGGTLHQHIDGHSQIDGSDRIHAVGAAEGLLRTLYGPRFLVNSAHHQAVDRLGDGLRVLARAQDGTVEAIGHDSLPIFAVQWHPERLCGAFARPETADGTLLFDALLSYYKKVK